jgi:histidyl-tRNA synthetase
MLVWQAALAAGAAQPSNQHVPKAYLVNVGEGTAPAATRLAEQLRDAGVHCVTHAGGGSFKSQLKKADASGAQFTLIIGESELAAGQVAVKRMVNGEQTRVEMAQLSTLVAALKAH